MACWVKKVEGGYVVAILRQTAANLRHRRLRVFKISIMPLNSPKWGEFQPQIFYFFLKKLPLSPCHDAMGHSLHRAIYTAFFVQRPITVQNAKLAKISARFCVITLNLRGHPLLFEDYRTTALSRIRVHAILRSACLTFRT